MTPLICAAFGREARRNVVVELRRHVGGSGVLPREMRADGEPSAARRSGRGRRAASVSCSEYSADSLVFSV